MEQQDSVQIHHLHEAVEQLVSTSSRTRAHNELAGRIGCGTLGWSNRS